MILFTILLIFVGMFACIPLFLFPIELFTHLKNKKQGVPNYLLSFLVLVIPILLFLFLPPLKAIAPDLESLSLIDGIMIVVWYAFIFGAFVLDAKRLGEDEIIDGSGIKIKDAFIKRLTPGELNSLVSSLKEISWNNKDEVVRLKEAIKNTWEVDCQVYDLTAQQVQSLESSFPLDTTFWEIDAQYQLKLSSNSIFVHAFGSWVDFGYAMFLYQNQIYYVNIAPFVKLTTSIYNRMDVLSHMAKIAITLSEFAGGSDRKSILFRLEGTLKQTD